MAEIYLQFKYFRLLDAIITCPGKVGQCGSVWPQEFITTPDVICLIAGTQKWEPGHTGVTPTVSSLCLSWLVEDPTPP